MATEATRNVAGVTTHTQRTGNFVKYLRAGVGKNGIFDIEMMMMMIHSLIGSVFCERYRHGPLKRPQNIRSVTRSNTAGLESFPYCL
jgi:hypothetical protein